MSNSSSTGALLALLKSKNIEVVPDFSGILVRGGHNNRYWFVGYTLTTASGAVKLTANFGDWRTNEEWSWEDSTPLSPEEALAMEEAVKALQKKRRVEKEKLAAQAAEDSEKFWAECVQEGFSPYLEKKGFKPGQLFGARLSAKFDQTQTIIPYRDTDGKVWGYQTITPEGDKIFLENAKISGNFFTIGEPGADAYICEGFATGATIFEATGKCVYVAFNSGNLIPASRALRLAYPRLNLTVVADNDRKTKDNPGVSVALQMLKEGYAQDAVIPEFGAGSGGTDVNDLHAEQGIEYVATLLTMRKSSDTKSLREKFLPGPSVATTNAATPSAGGGSGTLDPTASPTKKAKKLNELAMASMALEELNYRVLVQAEDLWLWQDTHWKLAESADVNKVKNLFLRFDPDLSSGSVDSVYRTFLRIAPQAKRNLFAPRDDAQSFHDGTLYMKELESGSFELVFRKEHNPDDECSSFINAAWDSDPAIRNELFEETLAAAFEGDPDKDQKILAIKEFAGAMLLPAFSRVMFFFGKAGSNKSTIALTLLNMLPSDIKSAVDPAEMEGFMKEALINRLINYNLDINESRPFPMPLVKRLLDREPEEINRKNKKVIKAVPPGVHFYAANSMPPNFEKTLGALARRITIVRFNRHVQVNEDGSAKEGTRKDFWKVILGEFLDEATKAQRRIGVLNFMKEGLARLVAQKGMFTHIEASQKALEAWHKDSNAILQFLEDIDAGEVVINGTQLYKAEDAFLERTQLFEMFKGWCVVANIPESRFSRARFYQALEGIGIESATRRGVRMISGFGVRAAPNSVA